MNIINHLKTKLWARHFLWSNNAILIYLALVKLVIHLLTANGYGYFMDELYWQAMTKHLDFGYVDVPPLAAYLAAISRLIFGVSLFAIHILPAIAGAVMVYLAGLTARELGGGRFAQWLSALAVLAAPWLLTLNSVFTYDPFDQLCTIILFYLIARIINRETLKKWLLVGIAAGLGVMTKLSMFFTVGALVISLLLTSRRKSFLTVWPWLAALIAVMICAPYLIWQSVHGWPLFTYWHNYALSPSRQQPPFPMFISILIFSLNPVLLPVWLLGLFYLLFHPDGKKYRIFGLNFLILLIFFTLMKMQPRMLVSACSPLLVAGAVWLERMITAFTVNPGVRGKSIVWLKRVYIGVVLISCALLTPFYIPILSAPVLERYLAATPAYIKQNLFYELPTAFPFFLSGRFGWPEIVKEVAGVYYNLSEAEQKKCVIWAGMYWDAGAIDLLGKKYGLPDAMSNCLSYQIWGADQLSSGNAPEVAVMLNTARVFPALNYFEEVTPVKTFTVNKYSIYWSGYPTIYICRKPRANFLEAWEKRENYL